MAVAVGFIALAGVEIGLPHLSAFLNSELEVTYFGLSGILLPVFLLWLLVGLAGGLTLLTATASWYLFERPLLELRMASIERTHPDREGEIEGRLAGPSATSSRPPAPPARP